MESAVELAGGFAVANLYHYLAGLGSGELDALDVEPAHVALGGLGLDGVYAGDLIVTARI